MAIQTITYDDKQYLNENSSIADVNKVNDTDMNMIKSVVNNNANNIGDLANLTTPVTGSLVGAINSIVDSGSNANGNYIKYADGTMICTKQKTVTVQISEAFGSMYETQSSINFGNYAATFTAIPLVVALCIGRTAILEGLQDQSTSSYGSTWLMRPVADSSTNDYIINLVAIGKWK